MTSFQNESKGRDVLSFGVKLYSSRAYIPRVLCFFVSHLSQGCATKVSYLFNYVPLFRENIGHFRENIGRFRDNMGLFRENKGSFGGNELILLRKKLILGKEMASVIVV